MAAFSLMLAIIFFAYFQTSEEIDLLNQVSFIPAFLNKI